MSSVAIPSKEISHTRVIVARLCGAVSMLFSSIWLLANGFVALQASSGAYDGPEGLAIAFLFTAPPVFFTSGIALLVVGRRRCKLVWISLGLYSVPIAGLIAGVIVQEVTRDFRI